MLKNNKRQGTMKAVRCSNNGPEGLAEEYNLPWYWE
jgi:hypothetical protein